MRSPTIIPVLFLLLLSTIVIGVPFLTANRDEIENEKEEIAEVIRDSIEWALIKDRELQKSTMAKDEKNSN